jgi:hypothetical protein
MVSIYLAPYKCRYCGEPCYGKSCIKCFHSKRGDRVTKLRNYRRKMNNENKENNIGDLND